MRRLVKICRKDILPLLDGDLLALIELAAECLLPAGRSLPFSKRRTKAKHRKAALSVLRDAFDWPRADANVLGVLYESLLDSARSAAVPAAVAQASPPAAGRMPAVLPARCRRYGIAKKQGRRRKAGVFYTPGHITRFLVRAALNACLPKLKQSPPRILDPACGCGAFLLAAFRELVRRYPGENPQDIAIHCLHGVDSDPAAIHVARLALWLEADLPKSAWPLLKSTIRVGDSLRDGLTRGHERFPIVVGNPPYRNVKRGIPKEQREFCKANYRSAKGQWDLSAPFVELALNHLLEPGGACGFIVPNPLLLAENYQPIREIILENDLVAFGPAGTPFADPGVEASLLVARAGRARRRMVAIPDARGGEKVERKRKIPAPLLNHLPFKILSHCADPDTLEPVLKALDSGRLVPLGKMVKFTRGIECGKRDPRVLEGTRHRSGTRPLIVGEAVKPFRAHPTHRFAVPRSKERWKVLKNGSLWSGDKQLLLRRVADCPIAAVVSPSALALNTIYVVRGDGVDDHAACAFLNSGPFRELFRQIFAFDDRLFPYLRASQLSSVPAPPVALADPQLAVWSLALHEMAELSPDTLEDSEAKAILARIDSRVAGMYERAGVSRRARPRRPRQSRRS